MGKSAEGERGHREGCRDGEEETKTYIEQNYPHFEGQ